MVAQSHEPRPPKRATKPASKVKPELDPPYVRSLEDLEALKEYEERLKAQGPRLPRIVTKLADNNVTTVTFEHPDPELASTRVMNALGTADTVLATSLINQFAELSKQNGLVVAENLEAHLAVVRGINPTDAVEALLAVQMAAIHAATMTAASRLARTTTIEQQDSASGMLNKLARTFAVQVETLKKHRSTGEQNIRVQHVTVHDGGQAIVAGQMQAGGGALPKSESQSHEPYGQAQSSASLLSHLEAVEAVLPCASSSRQEGLSVPRCERGRS